MRNLLIKLFILAASIFFLSSTVIFAADEMKITSSSIESVQLFNEALDKAENIELNAARDLLERAIKMDNNFLMAYALLALTGSDYNEQREILKKAEKFTAKASKGEQEYFNYVSAVVNSNRPEQEKHISALVKMFPRDKHVQLLTGNYFRTQNEFTKALKHLEMAVKIDPEFAPAYNLIGYTQIKLNQNDKAEDAFKKYITLKPGNPNPYDSYAEFLLNQGRYDESIIQYKKALETDPDFVLSYLGMGNNYVFKGNFDKARDSYQKMYEESKLPGQKLEALYWISIAYFNEGDFGNALKYMNMRRDSAKKNNSIPVELNSLISTAYILTEQGQYDEALKKTEEVKDVLRTADMDETLRSIYAVGANLAKCYTLTSENKISDADQLVSTCNQVSEEKDAYLHQTYHAIAGGIQIKKGNCEKALELLKESDPEDPLTQYYLSEAYLIKGDKENSEMYRLKAKNSHVNGLFYVLARRKLSS